jgi:hypothetical protein
LYLVEVGYNWDLSSFLFSIMVKTSSCPICKTPVEQDSEKCPTCKWVLNIDGLNREKYDLLIEWALLYYHEAKLLGVKYECNKQFLTHRIDSHRDTIDVHTNNIQVLQQQVNLLLKHLPASDCNRQDSSTLIDVASDKSATDYTSIMEDNKYPAAPMKEMYANNLSAVESDNSTLPRTNVVQNDSFHHSENSKLTEIHQKIISEYYHNSSDFGRNYDPKIAALTKDTINSIWRSEQKVIILTEADSGNYWIFERESICYLVPFHPLSYVNKNSYKVFSMIFDCENYTPDYQSMELVEAAIVTSEVAASPKTWRLQQQGKLIFR